jgi:nicotinamidase-related amidase
MDDYIQPHPDRAVLLTIDTQNDFTLPDAPAKIDGTAEAVPQMARLVKAFRSENAPIIHVVRLYKRDGSNVDRCRRHTIEEGTRIVCPGTSGAELVDELKPTEEVQLDSNLLLNGNFQELRSQEWVMYKPRWSAFYRTDLTTFLDSRDVDTIVVCGCNFPNCPRTTIYEASERDYRLVCVSDAISGTYEQGLEELEAIGVSVKRTTETIEWLTSS